MNTKRLIKYLFFTYIITWICWWGDALLVKVTSLTASDVIPMILFTVGGFGPTIAACLCMEGGFSRENVKRFLFGNRKKNWLFLLAAILLETSAFFISSNGVIESIPKSPMGAMVVMAIFLQATILYGGNEELGWRGTMQAILQEKLPSPIATLIVGVIWVCWHIPLWFIDGNSHQYMAFLTFAILGIALSYWLSAVYNVTGAVVFCMVLHGWTNTMLGLFEMNEDYVYYAALGALTVLSMLVSIYARDQRDKRIR